ncbi:MAG: sugar transferase [Cyclobacteriaceae bacterium]
MKTEIALIGLSEKTTSLLQLGYKVVNYHNQESAIEAFKFRSKYGKKLPLITLIRGYLDIDNSFSQLLGWLDGNSNKIPVIVLDQKPNNFKLKEVKEFGAFDYMYLDSPLSNLNYQIKRAFNQSKDLSVNTKRFQIPLSKRVFDIVLSSFLIVLLTPLFLIVALLIKIESKGPVFYKQQRVGSRYRIFNFFKFRSMSTNADSQLDQISHQNHYNETNRMNQERNPLEANCYLINDDNKRVEEHIHLSRKTNSQQSTFKKFKNDPRITRVGKFIRQTSIDELPQLVNVLLGDMSVVGNRPLPLYEAEVLTEDQYSQRFLGPAGITGLWQVTERGKANTSAESRKLLDNQYASSYNFWTDMKILFKTPLAVIQQENV